MAEKGLQHDLTLCRKKFKASVVVRDAQAEDPSNRKSLVSATKRATQQADDARRETEVKSRGR